MNKATHAVVRLTVRAAAVALTSVGLLATALAGTARAVTVLPRYVTLYVNNTASNASDLGACLNASQPCKTIGYAVGRIEAVGNTRATIDVTAGTYSENVTANVPASDTLTITGGPNVSVTPKTTAPTTAVPIFTVNGGTVNFDNLTITGAQAGGIQINGGTVGASHVAFSNDRSRWDSQRGGEMSLCCGATLTAMNDTFSDDMAYRAGGGVWNDGATAVLTNDTFLGDYVALFRGGGAVDSTGSVTVTHDTFSGNNVAGSGGAGILTSGSAEITDDTFATNSTFEAPGVAIQNFGTAVIVDDTFSGNQGGAALDLASGSSTWLANNILADGGTAASNCQADGASTLLDLGYNVSDTSDCGLSAISHDVVTSDSNIGLGALADNGGPTQTEAIGTASAAYHEVPLASCTINTDQRGVARPGTGTSYCDAGAFEAHGLLSGSW
jgi:hypothetical protein